MHLSWFSRISRSIRKYYIATSSIVLTSRPYYSTVKVEGDNDVAGPIPMRAGALRHLARKRLFRRPADSLTG